MATKKSMSYVEPKAFIPADIAKKYGLDKKKTEVAKKSATTAKAKKSK